MEFEEVVAILDESVGGPDADVDSHGAFWRGVTRDQFVTMKVGGRRLIELCDGANSSLIRSLRGERPFGSDLDHPPAGATLMRMPAYLPPVPESDIDRIQQWIDEGCGFQDE